MESDANSSFSLAQQQNALLSSLAQVQREWKEERAKLVEEHHQEVSRISERLSVVSSEKEHFASRAAELEQRAKDAERRAEEAEREASTLRHDLEVVRTDKDQLLRILHSTSQREKDGHMARLRPSVAQALGWDAGDSSEVYGTGSSSFHHGVHPASVYVGWGRRWEDRSSVGHASLRTDVLPVARRGLMDHPREREDRPGRGLAPRRRRHVSDSASEAHGSDDRAVASEASEASEASTASAFVSDLESSADSAESAGEATSGPADADASCWRKSDGAKWEIFHKALAAVSEAVRADEPWAGRHGARSSLAPRADGSGGEGKDEGDKSGGEESAEEEQEEEQDEQEEEGGVESGGEGKEEGEEEEEEEDAFVDASTTAPQCGIARGGVPVAADEAWRRAIAHLHGLWTAWAAETRAASSAVSRLEAERSALRHRLQRQRAAWRADRGRLRMCEAAEASARRRASQFERELRRVEARGQRWRQAVEAKLSELAKGRTRARTRDGPREAEAERPRSEWGRAESSPLVGRGGDAEGATTGYTGRRRSRWHMEETAAGLARGEGSDAVARSGRVELPDMGV